MFFFVFFCSFLFCSFWGIFFIDFTGYYLELFNPYTFCVDVPIVFLLDFISLFFFSCVSFISSMVFLYSKFYMADIVLHTSISNSRFFYLLFLFVVSMFFLVFSGSWVVVMLGWDGLGLISFLLVIYYGDSYSLSSGLITVLTNRIGDCFFIISFMYFFFNGWLAQDFLVLFSSLFFIFFIFLGCATKSAQLPFSSWLPAAMAAPTPVSSLVHSSTLVTAGVYLLIRFNFLFLPLFDTIMVFSLLTMSLAGLCSMYEKDFKKVVAMSTLSQLGFMVFSIAIGYWLFSFLHMLFHAFFKSSLFLSTGNLMHYLEGDQDSRNFGSLGTSFFSKLLFIISSLSLMGFPFSIGFYTKDLILGGVFFNSVSVCSLIFLFSCSLTVGYSFRLIKMGFMMSPTFFVSFSFKDTLFFFTPIVFLYFFCTFSGNFFFFFFSSPFIFSFFECFTGLLIILGGFFIFLSSPSFYSLYFSSGSILFLSFLGSPYLSFFLSRFSFSSEYSWAETYGAGGLILLFTKFFFTSNFFLLFSFFMSFLVIFILTEFFYSS